MLALMGPRKLDLAIATYRDLRPRLVEAAEDFGAAVRAIIDEAGINYLTVESRAKTVESFAVKARRLRERDPDADPMEEITDQVGVRVITYVQSDILAVAELLGQHYAVLEDRDMGRLTASEGRFGYASRHLLVSRDRVPEAHYEPLQSASIQLRRPAARVGRVRTRHPLQGHHPAGAGAGPRSSLHPRRRPARTADREFMRSVTGCRSVSVRRRVSGDDPRSAPRNWRPSSPVATPAPAGHAPSTTSGSPPCSSSSASRRWTS